MTLNACAHAWETILRAAISDEALWLAGHNDLSAGGLTHLNLESGGASATATERHNTTPAHPRITMPVLTDDQTATWRSASPDCSHHQAVRAGELPDCLANPAHTGDVPTEPTPAEITFGCDCGTAPCRHIAALAHAVTARLTTSPSDFTMLRGLPARPPKHRPSTNAEQPVTATRTAPGGKVRIPAHHAWAWYRDYPEPPLLSAYTPELAADAPQRPLPEATPPSPAPIPEQIHALIRDAAAQARAHLKDAARLECALHEDAFRLATTVPGIRFPEIAERLTIDVADLRDQISACAPTHGGAGRPQQ